MDRHVRRLIAFDCAGDTLVGTLDEGADTTGLLIVSGGNEIRAGAHRGVAMIARQLAASGTPIFRYDRRGVGDSGGANGGFASARDDLLDAAKTFRAEAPHVSTLLAFGNCDAATTLALHGRAAGIDRILIANPWVVDSRGDAPPPAAIRARYLERLRDPRSWRAGFSVPKLIAGLRTLAATKRADRFTDDAVTAIASWGLDATVLLAAGDATAIAFADAARRARLTPRTISLPTASHSFARLDDQHALAETLSAFITARA